MKKVLFISNHAGFSKFNAPYMQWFHDQGWQVDNASFGRETGYCDNQYDFPIKRNPLALSNIKAFFQLKKLCKQNCYDIIHCHTPVGGVLGRLCVNRKKCSTKVIYTAHGFHFYKGASLLHWLLFYPIEKMLAHRADCIVTINHDDFDLAKQKFNSTVRMIDGVGVNVERFKPVSVETKNEFRKSNGFSENDFIVVYCAQFIPRKNHIFLLNKIAEMQDKIPTLRVCLFGSGLLEDKIKLYAKQKGLSDIVRFLGYRKDSEKIYAMSDILISTSMQEGFGISLIEGMACGLPIVVSNIRGHKDIVNVAKENVLFDFYNNSFEDAVLELYKNREKRTTVGNRNVVYAKKFSIEHSLDQMAAIYTEIINGSSK